MKTTPTHRALLLMTASATFFGLMAFSAKLATARLSGPQVAMIRFAVGLTPVLFIPKYRRAAMHFQRLDLLFLRGFFGGMAVLFYFIAISHINVGVATLLNYTAPIFSGMFSLLFIGEKISPRVLIPAPIAFFGIYLVVRAQPTLGKWEMFGLLSAVCSGAAVTAMRRARRGENSWSVYASFCLLGLLTCAPFGIATWKMPHHSELMPLALTSLFAIGAQVLLTFSLRWIDAMTVGVISQLAVPIAMILGATLLNETIPPAAVVGTMLTLSGVVGVVYVTSLTKRVVSANEIISES